MSTEQSMSLKCNKYMIKVVGSFLNVLSNSDMANHRNNGKHDRTMYIKIQKSF